MAIALTAPIRATATPACAASARTDLGPVARSARMVGSSTHGASIIGRVSDEIDPSVVSTRGDNANAAAAITREPGLPIPSASATRNRPQKPTVNSSAHHSRWVIQPGTPSAWPIRKKVPCGNRYP
ncbi:hypothetical protein PICSAR132_01374 [Mycobacterium avium subsp. paratuberculosis]|nr:hypothetical protein PICSAR132_01374 [Mycobacterium avium subsp. paratuberculosis]CAG7065871.1 hypothetical protein PICSAR181_02385 [Mycobacterium avium subsp. paratuberculosis]CAG7148558.1 hypothetical protein PICSAR25_01095 [Mycobacterium avium subsp. paratuberculosis]CAG7215521.1 hypothetical protein PICSAR26_00677 [Mycobacterium avium subsp. paratuberculosis]CAG7241014.1 hypothetical protein PICSAR55_00558 [Mycobacterium avium subsp. paratuberculosis]